MPASDLTFVLLLLASLHFKHFICDGPLQTLAMVQAKGIYGKPMGIAHSAIHGAGTLLVFALAGFALPVVLGLALLDFAIHYHVDFSKETLLRRTGWTTKDGPYWWTFCADQGLHQLTYLLLVWLALKP